MYLDRTVIHPEGTIDDLSILVSGHTKAESILSTLSEVLEYRDDGVGFPLIASLSIKLETYDALVEGGYMTSLVIHQLGHALGFIPLKIGRKVSENPSFTLDYKWNGGYLFEGVNALEVFTQMLIDAAFYRTNPEVSGVPLDEAFTRAGYGGHWRSEIFDNEVMTGVYRGDHDQRPLSKLTIALMDDLGYEVNYEAADEYSLSKENALAINESRGKPVVNESDEELNCNHRF